MRARSTLAAPLDAAVQVAKALGHPTRLRMVAMLQRGPLCVCQLTAVLDAPSSTVSGHLLELRRAGVVREEQRGKWVEYRLNDDETVCAVFGPLLAVAARDGALVRDRGTLDQVTAVPAAILCEAGLDVARASKAAARLASKAPARRRRPRAVVRA